MDKKLIVNANVSETRIALLEDDSLAELYIERHTSKSLVGNIYKAKVSRVLPGMQSAFVNIGLDRSAFLYGGDVLDPEMIDNSKTAADDPRETYNRTPIEKLLKVGQEIIVQVAKEPLGSKGPRVTMIVTIPGRYLVLMPDFDSVGISRRIEEEETRQRLKDIIEKLKPPGMGVIIRTAAAQVDQTHLEKDLEYLKQTWLLIQERIRKAPAPALFYQEPNIILKTSRDLFTHEVSKIIVDDQQAYAQLKHFLADMVPGADEKLELYKGDSPIFDQFDIEIDIAKSLARKVWLPSGGYIVIDQTEALTSFDINTGKFVGTASARETILRTNLEAVKEIVSQFRIRNIGGIIIIDFIDMEFQEDREQVNQELEKELKEDKARTNIFPINELGLVQMTRKRTRESLERVMTNFCPFCDGRGRVHSVQTETYDLVRDLERHVLRTGQKDIKVRVREDILNWFLKEETQLYQNLVDRYDLMIHFEKGGLNMATLQESSYEILSSWEGGPASS